LVELRKKLGYTQDKFGALMGVPMKTYQNWERGIGEPQASTLAKLIDLTNVNLTWLLIGKGLMFGNETKNGDNEAIWADDKPDLIPVLCKIQAGPNGRFNDEKPLFYLPRPHGVIEKPLYGFEVIGDSMYPAYKPGDIVFATPTKQPRTGEDHIVQLSWGELVLKRIQVIAADRLRLMSINTAYEPMLVPKEEILALAMVVESRWGKNVKADKIEPDIIKKG